MVREWVGKRRCSNGQNKSNFEESTFLVKNRKNKLIGCDSKTGEIMLRCLKCTVYEHI